MASVQRLQQVERLATSHFTDDDSIRPMSKGGAKQVTNRDGREIRLSAPGFKSYEVLAIEQETVRLQKELIRGASESSAPPNSHTIKLFAAIDDYLKAKKATANTNRAVAFDRERLDVVKRVMGDVRLSAITGRTIEGFQAKRRIEGASNRTVNMGVGALRQVLKRFKQWRRLEDDVRMLTESGGEPVGRVLTAEEQERLFKTAEANPEWEHVYCAAILAASTSMRGVEVKHVRRKDFDAEKRTIHAGQHAAVHLLSAIERLLRDADLATQIADG